MIFFLILFVFVLFGRGDYIVFSGWNRHIQLCCPEGWGLRATGVYLTLLCPHGTKYFPYSGVALHVAVGLKRGEKALFWF